LEKGISVASLSLADHVATYLCSSMSTGNVYTCFVEPIIIILLEREREHRACISVQIFVEEETQEKKARSG
jgi:hypothetical protein